MNKQELIKKYKRLEGVWDAPGAETARQIFLQDLEQLDEPQKVTIPQFVADWIRKCKTFKSFAVSLSFALQPSVWEANGLSDESIEWLANTENQEIFARAWLDGYEVEKEKRYIVKIKSTKCSTISLVFSESTDVWLFSATIYQGLRFKHTRKEIEDGGFGEVFNSPLFEVEEVE